MPHFERDTLYWHDLPFSPNDTNCIWPHIRGVYYYLTARADFTSILRALFFSYGDHPLGIMVHDQTSLLYALMHETTIRESLYSKRLVVFRRVLARGTQSMFALQAKCRGGRAKTMRSPMLKICDGGCAGCGLCRAAALWCNHWWCARVVEEETGPWCCGEK